MKEFKEELFELMLKHASKELVDEMVAKYPSPEELKNQYDFSPEFKKRIEEILESEKKREKQNRLKNIGNKLVNTGNRIAIVVCIIVATFSVVAFTVPSIRVALMNFIIEKNEEYISFDLQGQGGNHSNEPADILLDIIPYVPEGFEIENTIENESALFITYTNNNMFIRFERFAGAVDMTIDGEDIIFETIIIRGEEVYTSFKNGMSTIIFNDENYVYKISSEIHMDELEKMAESILK